jgi:hypothetical protein
MEFEDEINKYEDLDDFVNAMLSSNEGIIYEEVPLRKNNSLFSSFVSLTQKHITPELFFNCLLSDQDLSKLLCTCHDMKEKILHWKKVFPIEVFGVQESMTDSKLGNLIGYYSANISKLAIFQHINYESLTPDGFQHPVSCLSYSLVNLEVTPFFLSGGVLKVISKYLTNLTSLCICHFPREGDPREGEDRSLFRSTSYLRYLQCFPNLPSDELNLIAKLTNLEKIKFYSVERLVDTAVINYSALKKIRRITICNSDYLTGLGLSYLVANKESLVKLSLKRCWLISSEGYHCLSTLHNLTKLIILSSKLDDIGLNVICTSCLLIEYLDIKREPDYNDFPKFSLMGYDNISCLIHLHSLVLYRNYSDVQLFNNTALTSLEIENCTILTDNGLLVNISSLKNLSRLSFKYFTTISSDNLSNLFHSLNNLSYLNIETYFISDVDDFVDAFNWLKMPLIYFPRHFTHHNFIHNKVSAYFSTRDIHLLTNLKYLALYGQHINDIHLSHLSDLVNLTHLELNGKHMTDEFLTYYTSSLKLKDIIDPPFFSLINEFGLSFLSSLFNLTYLSLRYNKTTDQGLSHLSCLVNLSFLDIGKASEISEYGLPYLFPLVNLVNLKLGKRIIHKEEFKCILSSKLVKLKNWDSVFESE